MAIVKSTLNKVTPRLDERKLKSLGVLSYDIDNSYPQRIEDIVNDSGTASTCLKLYTKYVTGAGARNADFGKMKINKEGLTVNKLIRKIAKSKGKFSGYALHFNYNALGQKTEINFIPFSYCRLTLEDSEENAGKVAIYDDWNNRKNKNIKKDKIDFLHQYDPSRVLEEVESTEGDSLESKFKNYKGQIWYNVPEAGAYPLAPFDSVLEDMQTEAQTKRFKHSTSTNNFLASHIIFTGVAEEDKDKSGESESLTEILAEFTGGDGAAGIIHIEKEFEDEFFQIEKLDHQDYDGLYEYTENSSRDSIIRNFLIPPVLMVQTAGKLGTSTEIADASTFYNDITEDDRKEIEETLREAFNNFAYEVNKEGDYSIKPLEYNKPIDPAYFPYYSKNEIRIANGDEPIIEEDGKEEEAKPILATELGVGGTTALVGIISNTELTPDQKKGTLKILFGFDEETVNEILGIETNNSQAR